MHTGNTLAQVLSSLIKQFNRVPPADIWKRCRTAIWIATQFRGCDDAQRHVLAWSEQWPPRGGPLMMAQKHTSATCPRTQQPGNKHLRISAVISVEPAAKGPAHSAEGVHHPLDSLASLGNLSLEYLASCRQQRQCIKIPRRRTHVQTGHCTALARHHFLGLLTRRLQPSWCNRLCQPSGSGHLMPHALHSARHSKGRPRHSKTLTFGGSQMCQLACKRPVKWTHQRTSGRRW